MLFCHISVYQIHWSVHQKRSLNVSFNRDFHRFFAPSLLFIMFFAPSYFHNIPTQPNPAVSRELPSHSRSTLGNTPLLVRRFYNRGFPESASSEIRVRSGPSFFSNAPFPPASNVVLALDKSRRVAPRLIDSHCLRLRAPPIVGNSTWTVGDVLPPHVTSISIWLSFTRLRILNKGKRKLWSVKGFVYFLNLLDSKSINAIFFQFKCFYEFQKWYLIKPHLCKISCILKLLKIIEFNIDLSQKTFN